jgi:tagaturonate reductase
VTKTVAPCLKPFSKVGLLLVVMINTSQIAEELIQYATWKYIPSPCCAPASPRWASPSPTVSAGCSTSPRGRHFGDVRFVAAEHQRRLVLAIEFFPPMTALPVILGIVSQQTICAIMASLLLVKREERRILYKGVCEMKSILDVKQPVDRPVRVLQFGEGNFLRAFVDWQFDNLNEKTDFNGNIVLVQPLERGMGGMINQQKGLYTTVLRGVQNGNRWWNTPDHQREGMPQPVR